MSRPFVTGALVSVALVALFLLPASGQSTLVSTGSVWRYFDQGSEPAGWKALGFNDTAWPSGPAQLGFGDVPPDDATMIHRTNSAGSTNITYYFRHTFDIPDPSLYSNLLVRLRRDDGAVVYLNEQEIFRSNMPPDPINSNTLALTTTADDGTNFFASLVSPALISFGGNQLAVEVHQSSVTSSDISFELEFSGNVNTAGYQPPSVALTSPLSGDTFGATALTLAATASDPDGTIAMVEFFDGTTWLGTATMPTNNAYLLPWTGITAGTHVLTAVAVDSTGLSSVSAPATIRVLPALVPRGSAWKYFDIGGNPGAAWNTGPFDDSSWSNGVAQLGFGDGDETTTIRRMDSLGSNSLAFYFRHVFTHPGPAGISNLVVRVLRDDGAIVYLNGVEVFRNNMPTGAVTHTTTATTTIGGNDENFHGAQASSGLLIPGANVLAVEIHQGALSSSDVSFDLELLPNVSPMAPTVTLTSPTNGNSFLGPLTLILSAVTADADSPVASVTFFDGANMLGTAAVDVTGGAAMASLFPPGTHSLFAVAIDAQGLSTTSAPVGITVIPAPVLATLISTGSVWSYFDTNYAPATGWRDLAFDDGGWKNGLGILGFGQLGTGNVFPTTTINFGPSGNRYITAYFRHAMQVTNAASVTNLAFRVLRDDGVVAYLNGVEIFRMNMGPEAVSYVTLAKALVSGTNELFYAPTNLVPPAGLLLEGTNLLAVELHQDNPATTGDCAFDLSLIATSPPTSRPRLQIQFDGANIQLTWNDASFVLEEAGFPQGPYLPSTNATSPAIFIPNHPAQFFRLVRP